MGLMTMLVLAFSTHVRLELRSISNHQNQHLARANARLGLELALAQLQAAAGPDQRVTASRMLYENQGSPLISGVWDTTQTTSSPFTWLISGPGIDTIELLGRGTLGENVDQIDIIEAPREEIVKPDGSVVGSFAWWFSDESVKASVGKINRQHDLKSAAGINETEKRRIPQVTMGRPRVEQLFTHYSQSSPTDLWQENSSELSKITTLNQMAHLPNISPEEIKISWHTKTRNAYGVLTDTKNGGLKRDLTYNGSGQFVDNFMMNPSIRKWVNHRIKADDSIVLSGYDEKTATVSTPLFATPLIFTEFALYLGIFRHQAGSNDLRVQLRLRSDIWNPHSFPMLFTSSNLPDMIIEIRDLPIHTVKWETARGKPQQQSGEFLLNLNEIIFTNNQTKSTFTLTETPVRINSSLSAGEVRTISENAQGPINGIIQDPTPGLAVDDRLWTSAPESAITVRIKTTNGDLIQEFKSIPIPAFDTNDILGHEIRSRNSPNLDEYQFVYHFRFEDETTNSFYSDENEIVNEVASLLDSYTDMEVWSNILDPRGPVFDFESVPLLSDMFYISNPGTAANDAIFLGRPEFFYGGSGTTARSYYRFFDVPSIPPLSVGSLQHLLFTDKPPFITGHPNGENLNQVFDTYFLSTVPQNDTGWEPVLQMPLANTHLTPIDSKGRGMSIDSFRHPLSAANFLIEGAFNINSTNIDAWKTILGGINLYDWKYRVNEPSTKSVERDFVKNGLFRFPFGADRHFRHPFDNHSNYPEISLENKLSWYRDTWQPDWAISYTVGMRELRDGSNTDKINDLEDLATAIVELIKLRGSPFTSISDFVNSGIIQKAIDNTRINTATNDSFSDIWNDVLSRFPINSPSFLSQADVMQALAPLISSRSDTFILRAYGDAQDQSGNITARAWFEAEVQRIPEPFTFRQKDNQVLTNEDYFNPPCEFGRRFIITAFRWLTPEEI